MKGHITVSVLIFFCISVFCAACAATVSGPSAKKTAAAIPVKAVENKFDHKTITPEDNTSTRRMEAMSKYQDVQDYIKEISVKYKLDNSILIKAFDSSYFDYRVVELMDIPAEKKFWPEYSDKLLSKERIDSGKKYMADNKKALDNASARWDVPSHVITAIIGVESAYGKTEFKRTAVTSLGTLAFEYPRRSTYFKGELTKLFILADKEKADPLSYRGSYAGAIGIAQFMPDNIMRYGKDGNGDGRVDIVAVHEDAIESVAFYIKEHGWKKGKNTAALVALKQSLPDSAYASSPCDTGNRMTVKTLKNKGVMFSKAYPDNDSGVLMKLDKDNDTFISVVFFENACPIHRYNSSMKYTAAISFLAETLSAEDNKTAAKQTTQKAAATSKKNTPAKSTGTKKTETKKATPAKNSTTDKKKK